MHPLARKYRFLLNEADRWAIGGDREQEAEGAKR